MTVQPHFRSRTYATLTKESFNNHDLNEAFQKSQNVENYLKESSGWNIKHVINLKIHTIMYTPLSGSSYMDLPHSLRQSNCILNIRNIDNKCFNWSILASLYPVETEYNRVITKSIKKELNMQGIIYPVCVSKVDKFESQNINVSVNMFTFENNEILPFKITNHNDRLHHINLLLLKNDRGSKYCLIKDLNMFLNHTKSNTGRHYFCPYCLHGFTQDGLLQNHIAQFTVVKK